MKYQIKVEGGFAGITKEYNGELPLSPNERAGILNLLHSPIQTKNERLRDGFVYSFALSEGSISYSANFDEANLPAPLKDILARISKQS